MSYSLEENIAWEHEGFCEAMELRMEAIREAIRVRENAALIARHNIHEEGPADRYADWVRGLRARINLGYF
jgi:hypothetical protein